MIYVGMYDCYENIKIKLYYQHIKAMKQYKFLTTKKKEKKENDCKV